VPACDEKHATLDSSLTVIPSNIEKFVAFQIGKLRFLDSLQSLNASLDKLVGTLSSDAFVYKSKFSPCPVFTKQKGAYPYEYMNDRSKFGEKRLPPKDAFYSALIETPITDAEYARTQRAWNVFECKTMQDYHEYLKTDVVLLADVFENFRKMCMENYGLDPAHF